ncbi:MAG: hypothetical protein WDZ28_04925 [Simkaniaceae bacterium]
MIRAFFLSFFCFSLLFSETISEKRNRLALESEQDLSEGNFALLNQEMGKIKRELIECTDEVKMLHEEGAQEEKFKSLLSRVNQLRALLKEKESYWHAKALQESRRGDEGYGFWDQEETTLSQLIMEYGSNDFLYVIPPEMMSMKLTLHSQIPVPRDSWSDLLRIVLSHNGIGVKEVNAYTRQLYILRQSLIAVSMILNEPEQLKRVRDHERIIYLFTPKPEHVKGVASFFERFRDPKTTFIYQVSQKVAIVGEKEEVEKLIALHEAVFDGEHEKQTKVITLKKTTPLEMQKILNSFFGGGPDRSRLALAKGSGEGLEILPLVKENALVLIGMSETLERACMVVQSTEQQIDDPSEMTVFWYNCRHSDPFKLSDVLERVYSSLVHAPLEGGDLQRNESGKNEEANDDRPCNVPQYPNMPQELPTYGPPSCPPMIQPPPVRAGSIKEQTPKSTTKNFVPYGETGSIMMVVRRDTLLKIKELLKKLDVPKKMVEIEVLLFEKKVKSQDNAGLNILKIGSCASQTHKGSVCYDSTKSAVIPGLLELILSRKKSASFPAFDLAYSFLMTQDDVRVNASPSVTTVNQTPATIRVVEELSINNGAAPLETQTGITFENSFSRAQFGITIVVTPTIHEPDPDDKEDDWYVTLQTNVLFDNITSDLNDRPDVTRRSIENLVRVADGETVILGGLRQKQSEEKSEKIPFLGEIPGIAKLFSSTRMTEQTTEMFIFITPRVIMDNRCDIERIRRDQLSKRAGDIPEYLERLCDAQRCEKERVFKRSWDLLFKSGLDDSFCNPY